VARGFESVSSGVAHCVIFGIGIYGYILGLQAALHLARNRS